MFKVTISWSCEMAVVAVPKDFPLVIWRFYLMWPDWLSLDWSARCAVTVRFFIGANSSSHFWWEFTADLSLWLYPGSLVLSCFLIAICPTLTKPNMWLSRSPAYPQSSAFYCSSPTPKCVPSLTWLERGPLVAHCPQWNWYLVCELLALGNISRTRK